MLEGRIVIYVNDVQKERVGTTGKYFFERGVRERERYRVKESQSSIEREKQTEKYRLETGIWADRF
jgi:hypothetical protein